MSRGSTNSYVSTTRKILDSVKESNGVLYYFIKKCVICNRYGSETIWVHLAPLPIHRVKDVAVYDTSYSQC